MKENMLPLSVREEWSYRLRLTDILCLIPTATSLYTKNEFMNNNYYLIIKHLTPYSTYLPALLRPINKVYNIK